MRYLLSVFLLLLPFMGRGERTYYNLLPACDTIISLPSGDKIMELIYTSSPLELTLLSPGASRELSLNARKEVSHALTDYEKRNLSLSCAENGVPVWEKSSPYSFEQDLVLEFKNGKLKINEDTILTDRGYSDLKIKAGKDVDFSTSVLEVPDLNPKISFSEINPTASRWEFFDRENDPDYALPGGQYTLAMQPSEEGQELVYVSGAKINPEQWQPGRVKAFLTPTPAGDYLVQWIDAQGFPVEDEITAVIAQDILTVTFPLYRAKLRFLRK